MTHEEAVLSNISDGMLFEKFIHALMSSIRGFDFLPIGGTGDKAKDGLEYVSKRAGVEKNIYQISINDDPRQKIRKTILDLKKYEIEFDALNYISSKQIADADSIIDDIDKEFEISVRIYDRKWIVSNIQSNTNAENVFNRFVDDFVTKTSHVQSGDYFVDDLVVDPRLFIFLKQQECEQTSFDFRVQFLCAFIIKALGETDPEKGIIKSDVEILESVNEYSELKFKTNIDELKSVLCVLEKKPRKIQFHPKLSGYCLPFESRTQLQKASQYDIALEFEFECVIKSYLEKTGNLQKSEKVIQLTKNVLSKVFYEQGIQFTDFIQSKGVTFSGESDIGEYIKYVVDKVKYSKVEKQTIAELLLDVIRFLIYSGNEYVNEYLKRLSKTFLLFLFANVDPKIVGFMDKVASNLELFVCTSIIIPALSEVYLPKANQRHTNLLREAKRCGVKLFANEEIIKELRYHFRHSYNEYKVSYQGAEELYEGDNIVGIPQEDLLIKTYIYAKQEGKVKTFESFLNQFVTPSSDLPSEEEVISCLNSYGIEYRQTNNIKYDDEDYKKLVSSLSGIKSHSLKAETKSRILMKLFSIRELNCEKSVSIYGYKTWWLSKDSTTYRTVNNLLADKYPTSCYMRPDFLYNYIVMTPERSDVENAYEHLFPSLIGVAIGKHLPDDAYVKIKKITSEHKELPSSRVKAKIRNYIDQIKASQKGNTTKWNDA